nr:DEAD/DEAH box helicase [Cyanobium sp. NS01]
MTESFSGASVVCPDPTTTPSDTISLTPQSVQIDDTTAPAATAADPSADPSADASGSREPAPDAAAAAPIIPSENVSGTAVPTQTSTPGLQSAAHETAAVRELTTQGSGAEDTAATATSTAGSTGHGPETAGGDQPGPASGFAHFGFDPELLQALEAVGYSEPSPIQSAAIPELMLGRDLVGQAQTGTGKTAAFALPMLAGLDPEQRKPQVLVLAPTRELAIQVAESFSSYASHLPQVRTVAVYGGADFRDQIHHLRRGAQIVVGTPGRVMDHMRQGTLDLSELRALVLDEADEMLRMGFIDDVEWVLGQLPEQRQVVLFSATMPAEIRRISQQYLNSPAEITIKTRAADASRIRQRYLTVQAPLKLAALERVLESETSEGVIIFARTKAITLNVAESLEAHGYDVAVLNGDVPQAQRERTIERLKTGQVNVLVATDVAARGLDVERIALVINYDIPFDGEAYVHRIGRTGRAGRKGDAILFLTPRERRFLGGLERAVGKPIEPMEVPNNATINQSRLDRLRQRLTGALQQSTVSADERALLGEILQRVAQEQGCSPDQLALAALELGLAGKPLLLQGNDDFTQVRPQGPARRDGRDGGRDGGRELRRGGRPERSLGAPEADMDRFRVELGWRDRIKPGNLVGAIANETGLQGKAIGRIQIFDAHSIIDLPKGMPEDIFASLRELRVLNKPLQISRFRG